MSATFALTIVSPASAVFSGEAAMVEIPGAEGDFGVLPGHMNLLSLIRPGIINVKTDGEAGKRFFVTGGYADVSATGTIILSDTIEDLSSITPAAAQTSLDEAQAALEIAATEAEKAAATKRFVNAQALVNALHP